jgi:hypothetical protein
MQKAKNIQKEMVATTSKLENLKKRADAAARQHSKTLGDARRREDALVAKPSAELQEQLVQTRGST